MQLTLTSSRPKQFSYAPSNGRSNDEEFPAIKAQNIANQYSFSHFKKNAGMNTSMQKNVTNAKQLRLTCSWLQLKSPVDAEVPVVLPT